MTDNTSLVALARTVVKLEKKRQRLCGITDAKLYAIHAAHDGKCRVLQAAHSDKVAALDADLATAREALHTASEQGGSE